MLLKASTKQSCLRLLFLSSPKRSCCTITRAIPKDMKNTKFTTELERGIYAVRLASKLCQHVQRQLVDAEKNSKSDDSPVTVADYGAQVLVAWALSKSDKNSKISMVAEEDTSHLRQSEGQPMLQRITALTNKVLLGAGESTTLTEEDVLYHLDLGSSKGGPSGQHWVLDPIDGTRGFVGGRQYAVCLALLHEGQVVLGLLGCPNLPRGPVNDDDGGPGADSANSSDRGCLFIGQSGHGAYATSLWDVDSEYQRIHVSAEAETAGVRWMESYESRHSSHDMSAAVATLTGARPQPLRMDSQAKYGLLARGEASLFMRFPPSTYREKIWDHAAGVCIVEEAGGKVTDALGQPLDFSKGRFLETMQLGIVAAPLPIHAKIIQAVSSAASTTVLL